MDRYYLYDGTFNGFLSAVARAYAQHEYPLEIISSERRRSFMTDVCEVKTEQENACFIAERIVQLLGKKVLLQVVKSFLSHMNTIETTIFTYIYLSLNEVVPTPVVAADDAYAIFAKAAAQVDAELVRMAEKITFIMLDDELFYAGVEPFYNILPLILPLFKKKLEGKKWIIHDRRRKIALFCDGSQVHQISLIRYLKHLQQLHGSVTEMMMAEMWCHLAGSGMGYGGIADPMTDLIDETMRALSGVTC